MLYTKLKILFSLITFLFLAISAFSQDYIITDFGARSGEEFMNTASINDAIVKCNENGGGRVVIPSGVFRSGTIIMRDNVELHLRKGAVLLASTDYIDFPMQPRSSYRSLKDSAGWRALIYANEANNISVTGEGLIDGNGQHQLADPKLAGLPDDMDGRTRNILFISSRNILVEGIEMKNAGIWNQHYLNCEDVIVNRIKVFNHANRNNDGIDIDGCRRFILSNSVFDTDDDAIVLKATGEASTEDVTITNCIISSFCNGIKTGTESTGGFKNITVSNCVIKPSRYKGKLFYGHREGITGISLESVDGGHLEGISISNITIEGTLSPLYIRLANRGRKHIPQAPQPGVGTLQNVSINNLVAYGSGNYSPSITGIPGHPVRNISLSNVQFFNVGGLKKGEYADSFGKVAEDEKGYPQPTVWGPLPSSGLFIRHAENIQINGLMLGSDTTEIRIPVMAKDVKYLNIGNISNVRNSNSSIFFYGEKVENVEIQKPAGWIGEVVIMGK